MGGNEKGLQLAGSRINFNRRDPINSRIYNAVFVSWNSSGLIHIYCPLDAPLEWNRGLHEYCSDNVSY